MTAKKILIIGATSGVGQRLAERIIGGNHDVVLAGRHQGRLDEVTARVGGSALHISGDYNSIVAACSDAATVLGGLDGVVCCAGSLILKPAHLTREEELDATIAANVKTAFATVAGAGKVMQSTGGSIVLISSAAARIGLANHEAIAAAKGAVMGLTLSAAATYAGRGIRVNCIAPGLVETPLTERITSSEVSRKASLAMHALGRLGTADDIAAMAEFMLVGPSTWMTGQIVGIDGGLGSLRSRG
jgi:NAD(P)-dependent dehydrogenase (short-subunit alcohol dehydrogenase family)